MKSYQYIPAFLARDTTPIGVVDASTAAARDAQVVKLARNLLSELMSDGVVDLQVLHLHRDMMKGFF